MSAAAAPVAPDTYTVVGRALTLKDFRILFPAAEGWSVKVVAADTISVRRYHKLYTPTTWGHGHRSNVVKDSLRILRARVKSAFQDPATSAGLPLPLRYVRAVCDEEFSGPGPNPMYFRHAYAEILVVLL